MYCRRFQVFGYSLSLVLHANPPPQAVKDVAASEGFASFSANEQVQVCLPGAAPVAGIVLANESGGIASAALRSAPAANSMVRQRF